MNNYFFMNSPVSNFLSLTAGFSVSILIYSLLRKKVCFITNVKGGYPFIGHTLLMLNGSPWDIISNWVKDYGTLFKFQLFGSDVIVISNPADLQIVLNTKLSMFKKDVDWTYLPFMGLLKGGIVTSEGTQWRNQRTLISAHFRVDILKDIPMLALFAVKRLYKKLNHAKVNGTILEMAEEFRHLTLQVIGEAFLSLTPEESDQTFAFMYLPIVNEANARVWRPDRMYLPTPAWFKFNKDLNVLNNFVCSIITKRWVIIKEEQRQNMPSTRRHDLLDKILSPLPLQDTLPTDVMNEICGQIKTYILAGHETSASMLSWTLYELSRKCNKVLLSKLHDEAKEIFKGCYSVNHEGRSILDTIPSMEQLNKLVYSECCLRESLRKYSVVPTVVRVASEDIRFGNDAIISKGSTLMINIQGVHHNPNYWPNPFDYQPERFLTTDQPLNEDTHLAGHIAPYTFLPFIDGPRRCLGQYLSLLESKIVLSALLLSYEFNFQNEDEAGMKHPYIIPICPKVGHFVTIS